MGLVKVDVKSGLDQFGALKSFLASLKKLGLPIVSPYVGSSENKTDSWIGVENWNSMSGVFNRWRKVNSTIPLYGFDFEFNDSNPAIKGDLWNLTPISKLVVLQESCRDPDPQLLRHCRAMLHGARINSLFKRNVINLTRCRQLPEKHVGLAETPINSICELNGTQDSFEIEAKLFQRLLMYYLHRLYVHYESVGDEMPFEIKRGMEIVHIRGKSLIGLLICSDKYEYNFNTELEFILGTARASKKPSVDLMYSTRNYLKRFADEVSCKMYIHDLRIKS
ncbi:hypothetical protein HK100_009575 [Physocladia obscura]|uniref:Uncharacterized protein n=1 Tax=Physocladia obscura TaxID=109957 RepID=A0AAD5T5U6_9FUNG|nr:hypothetical protein HK100_009575 [Physocladia obscura]